MLDAVTRGRSSPKGALAPCPAVKTIGCVLRPSFEDQRVLHTISGSTVHSPSSARGTECKRLGILGRHASGAVEATCATLLCARPVGPREAAGYLSADIDAALIVQALCLVYRAQCGQIGPSFSASAEAPSSSFFHSFQLLRGGQRRSKKKRRCVVPGHRILTRRIFTERK
jgi:hypothetical protein